MHEDSCQSVLTRGPQQGVEVLKLRVNAAVGAQSQQVQLPSRFACALHGRDDGGILDELARGNRGVDARNVHLHHAPGANVQVPHFAVAHLPIGQAHEVVGGLDERVGILAQQLIVGRLLGQRNGVVGGFGAIAPSIKDGQKERTLVDRHEKTPQTWSKFSSLG